jgi:hypothetical protein
MQSNPSCDQANILYAYDSFSCSVNGGFFPHLMAFIGNTALRDLLLITEGQQVNWLSVFSHHLDPHIEAGRVVPVETELSQSTPSMSVIALMHIDSPKFYRELKYILFRFFPLLKVGAVVIFQDFFYHWSANIDFGCSFTD